jgi:hypothetical protein
MSITKVEQFKIEKFNIHEPKACKGGVGSSKIALDYQGDQLVLKMPKMFSYGLQRSKFKADQLQMALVADLEKQELKTFYKSLGDLLDKIKNKLYDERERLELYDLELSDLKHWKMFTVKKEKGVIVKGSNPVMYLKLMSYQKKGEAVEYTTILYDKEGEDINPLEHLDQRCDIEGLLTIKGLYISSGKIYLQTALREAEVEFKAGGANPKKIERMMRT